MSPTEDQLSLAFEALGVRVEEVERLKEAPDSEEASQLLEEIRCVARKRYRLLAKDFHPDRTASDPDKTELFKLLTFVLDQLDSVKLLELPKPRRRLRVSVRPARDGARISLFV